MLQKIKISKYFYLVLCLTVSVGLFLHVEKKTLAADCSTTTTAITQASSNIFYIEKDSTPQLDSNYVAYKIQTGALNSFSDLWVTASNFSDSTKLKLAPNEDGRFHVGALSTNSTAYVYFYLQGAVTASSQSYRLTLYNGHPSYGGSSQCTSTVSHASVNDTTQAAANKVTSVVSSSPYIGGNMTITVNGDTGVMGGTGTFAYSAASLSTWPADCYELHDAQITLTGGNVGTYDHVLILNGLNSAASSYTIVYTLIAKCTTASSTTVTPVNYINSGGTNIKHTNTGSTTYTSIPPLPPAANNLTLVKSVSPDHSPGASTPTYSLTFTNSGSGAVTIDTIRDTLPSSPASVSYVNGTSVYDGSAISNPSASGQTLSWSGNFSVPGNSSRTLTFQANIPDTTGTYTNTAYGLVEATQIDTTSTTSDNSPASVSYVVGIPNLSASTKSVSDQNGGNVEPGDTLRYTLTLINSGTGPGTGVSATDTINTNTENLNVISLTNCGSLTDSSTSTALNVTGISVAVGVNCVIVFDVNVKTPLNDGTAIDNTATISAATEGGAGASPSSATKTVDATPDLVVNYSENDADNTVLRNQVITYTVTIQNNGNGRATDISLNGLIDADATLNTNSLDYTNCGSPDSTSTSTNLALNTITIEAGQTCTITFDVAVNGGAANGATIPASVDVSAAAEGGNNPAPVSASTLTVWVPTDPNLSGSSKTVTDQNGGSVEPGDTLLYTINILNGGDLTGTGISVVDDIDSDTTNLTNVVIGAFATNCGSPTNSSTSTQLNVTGITVIGGATTCKITYEVTVKSPLNEGTAIDNSATISAAIEGGSGATPSSITQFVDATPNLVVNSSEDDADNTVYPNQTITYTTTIENNGNGRASSVNASSSMSVRAVLNTGSFNFTNCGSPTNSSTSSNLSLSNLTIEAGQTCTITYQISVSNSADDGDTIVSSTDFDAASEGGNDPGPASATTLNIRVLSAPGNSHFIDGVDNLGCSTNTSHNNLTIAWDSVSGAVSYEVSLDGGEAIDVGSNTSYDWAIPAGDGTHHFSVSAVNELGDVSEWSESCDVIIDQTGPTVDAGTDKTQKVSFTQDATASDSVSGIATYAWTQVSGPGTASFSNAGIEDPEISADTDGTYVLKLTVTDNVGNSADDTFSLIWDTTPPVVNIPTHPASLTKLTTGTFEFDATDNIFPSDQLIFTCQVDSGPIVACTSPFTSDALGEGDHTVTIYSTDPVGNTGYNSYTWYIDITPPVITLLGDNPVDINTGDSYSDAGATALDNHDGDITAQIVVDNNVDNFTVGSYTVNYDVVDAAGNNAVTVVRVVQVNDIDMDGVDFTTEANAPNGGDANNDGIPDASQEKVTSFVNPVTSKYAILDNTANCKNTNVSQAFYRDLAVANTNTTYQYPAGLMSFSLVCPDPGMTVGVVQYYFGLENNNLIAQKYNPQTNTYKTINDAVITKVTIGGQEAVKIAYQITDGGELDQDGLANGVIVDPSGPAVVARYVSAPNTGIKPGVNHKIIIFALALGSAFLLAGLAQRKSNSSV